MYSLLKLLARYLGLRGETHVRLKCRTFVTYPSYKTSLKMSIKLVEVRVCTKCSTCMINLHILNAHVAFILVLHV
jgi:hypothetical protein